MNHLFSNALKFSAAVIAGAMVTGAVMPAQAATISGSFNYNDGSGGLKGRFSYDTASIVDGRIVSGQDITFTDLTTYGSVYDLTGWRFFSAALLSFYHNFSRPLFSGDLYFVDDRGDLFSWRFFTFIPQTIVFDPIVPTLPTPPTPTQTVPEPSTILGAITVLSLGILCDRRTAKRSVQA